MREKLEELFRDSEFAKKAMEMTPEELTNVLNEKGIDVSLEDIVEAGKMLNDVAGKDEIDLESLETVTGGGKVGDVVAGVLVGVVIGVGALAVGAASVVPW